MKTLNRENHFACSFVFDYYYTNQNNEDYNLDMLKVELCNICIIFCFVIN
ncbi:hypothetical protein ACE6H2_010651 [Prunus campanulata]